MLEIDHVRHWNSHAGRSPAEGPVDRESRCICGKIPRIMRGVICGDIFVGRLSSKGCHIEGTDISKDLRGLLDLGGLYLAVNPIQHSPAGVFLRGIRVESGGLLIL